MKTLKKQIKKTQDRIIELKAEIKIFKEDHFWHGWTILENKKEKLLKLQIILTNLKNQYNEKR